MKCFLAMARWGGRLALLAAAGYAGFVLLMWVFQRRLIYFPERETSETMAQLAAAGGFEAWASPEGETIGWRTREGDPARVLLILHGNAGYALRQNWLAGLIRRVDPRWKVYILEYPGYGARGGVPSQEALRRAAVEALDALPAGTRPVALGQSLGTGVASQLAAAAPDRIRGLILLTPFDSLASAGQAHYPHLPVAWLLRDRFDSVKALKAFAGPTAVIVGGEDTVTPPAGGKKLFESLRGPKRLWEAEGAGHNDAASALGEGDWREILSFVSS